MYGIAYINPNQYDELDQLLEMHEAANSVIQKEKIGDMIQKITALLRQNQKFLEHVQINRDGFLGALRRIEWAYHQYQKAPCDQHGHDLREAYLLVFFHNSKCFFEISKKCFPNKCTTNHFQFKRTFRDITTIRNFFAHSYEKDFLGEKSSVFVKLNPNHHLKQKYSELFELEIIDFVTSEKKYSLFFSLQFFLFEIQSILKKLIENLEENTSANTA